MIEEIWKDIAGYEGKFKVSNFGRIYQLEHFDAIGHKIRGKIRSTKTKTHKYESFSPNGGKNRLYVHRVVAIAFLGDKSKYLEVNHKDGNTKNNKVDNLEWVTRKENITHSRLVLKRHQQDVNKKPVFCIELQKWFNSISEASKFFGKKSETIEALDEKNKTFAGYHWSSKEEPYVKEKYTHLGKKWVKCVETNKSYLGLESLSKSLGVNHSSLRDAIKYGTRCKGLHWTYL